MLLRIDRILSDMGLATRSEAKRLAKEGRILVDGAAVRSSDTKVDPERARIFLNGEELHYRQHVCVMLNKPAGYVSATEDKHDPVVLELLPEDLRRRGLAPAGRQDKDAEGLLLLTDDGDLAHRIITPAKNVWKRYYVRHQGTLGPADQAAFEAGLDAGGGLLCKPARLELISENEAYVYLTEGKFHQVKRMLASRGAPVEYLKRLSVGGLELDPNLEIGEYRELLPEEIEKIFGNDM